LRVGRDDGQNNVSQIPEPLSLDTFMRTYIDPASYLASSTVRALIILCEELHIGDFAQKIFYQRDPIDSNPRLIPFVLSFTLILEHCLQLNSWQLEIL
jgi:hypothetical protein